MCGMKQQESGLAYPNQMRLCALTKFELAHAQTARSNPSVVPRINPVDSCSNVSFLGRMAASSDGMQWPSPWLRMDWPCKTPAALDNGRLLLSTTATGAFLRVPVGPYAWMEAYAQVATAMESDARTAREELRGALLICVPGDGAPMWLQTFRRRDIPGPADAAEQPLALIEDKCCACPRRRFVCFHEH